jgi:hypothetical protein
METMVNLYMIRIVSFAILISVVLLFDLGWQTGIGLIILWQLNDYVANQFGYINGMASSETTCRQLEEYLKQITEIERTLKEKYGYDINNM